MARLLTALLGLTCAIATATAAAIELHPLSDAFIDLINKEQKTWTAGRNFAEDTPIEYLRRLNGAHINKTLFDQLPVIEHRITYSLPENFDARDKWRSCPSLNEIRDQGSCGSGWAIAAVSVMTDLYCIHSRGRQFHFSAEDLLSCSGAGDCSSGGDPISAWQYWCTHGLVSGGNYGSNQGCRPYSIKPCIHYGPDQDGLNKCTGNDAPTPQCKRQCSEESRIRYERDLKRCKNFYFIRREENIQAYILLNGPVEAYFTVYEDFLNYKSGVYQHTKGKSLGGHAVKLLGWGVENGTNYWLGANSWNEHFGDKGFFKILRGMDECGIEETILTGEPII